MRFDDRLATVLSQPVVTTHDRTVRWRQLVDLLARGGDKGERRLVERAIAVLREDRNEVREAARAAAARAIAGAPVPLALVTLFAEDSLAVAAPLLANVTQDDALAEIRAAASPEVGRFLDSFHAKSADTTDAAPPSRPGEPVPPVPSLHDVIERNERRIARPPPPPRVEAARRERAEPVGEGPSVFRWECNASGEIDWVGGAARGPLIGRSIAVADVDEGVDDCVERAFAIRAPFRECLLDLGDSGVLAGRWAISGAPAFAPADGRFIGYRGIALRGVAASDGRPALAVPPAPAGTDALREMIHEIKTPLNAIIGFAEIIDGQYFGPAHRRYRERAAQIVANARSLLEAANDLDYVARAQAAGLVEGQGTQFAAFFPAFADELTAKAARLGVRIDFVVPDRDAECALDPSLTGRLLNRFVDAVLSATAASETLTVRFSHDDSQCALSLTRPKATILATRTDLLDPEFTIGDADRALLGIGFSLRLVDGLADLAGGALAIEPDNFTLILPAGDRALGARQSPQ